MSKKILAFIFVVLLLSVSLFSVSAVEHDAKTDGSNWMSAVDGSSYITSINIPGTHDSATAYCTFGLISQTQFLNIEAQLYAGVRYFDMRFELKNDEFYAMHGISSCHVSDGLFAAKLTAEDTIEVCKRFLDNNPGETILFQLKEVNSTTGDSFFDLFYSKYIQGDENSWYLENKTPTLDEARGKIVLLRVVSASAEKFNDINSGINFGSYPYVEGTEVIDFRLGNIWTLENGNNAYSHTFVQDSYKLAPRQKWEAVSAFWNAELIKENYNINMTNCTGGLPFPIYTACEVNAKISEYEFEKGAYYGIVGLEFANEELCEKIYMSNNLTDAAYEPTETPASARLTASQTYRNSIMYFIFNTLARII